MGRGVIESAALKAMARGWAVFPVKGKIPATTKGVLDASTEERLAAIWFERHPDRGMAVATGEPSGVWVLDLDGPEAVQRFGDLQEKHGALIEKGVASKTARGYHLFFRMPAEGEIRNSASKVAEGIDVRGTGGYVVAPPSPHPEGEAYRWVCGRGPDETPLTEAPTWLLDMVRASTNGRHEPAGPIPERISEGGRNATLTSLAGSMRRRGASEESILAALEAENATRCMPPLPDDEVRRIASSVAQYTPTRSDVSPPNGSNGTAAPVMELADRAVLSRIRDEKLQPLSVVRTPWPTWNRVCRGAGGGEGLAHGWHVIIGASSGAGKSLAAINLVAAAVRAGEHVCLISLEMSQQEVLTRLLTIYSGQEARKLEHGRRFSPDAWDRATEILQEAGGSIRVNPEPISRLEEIALVIERYHGEGCRTFIVDYLQLAWVRSAETMVQQVTEVSHTIRGLARKHCLLSIGLSQVNRQMSFGGGELRKEGLLGGSSLENDADMVMLIGKQERHAEGLYKAEVKIDKNRHGPPVEWGMILDTTTLQMREAMPDEEPSAGVG